MPQRAYLSGRAWTCLAAALLLALSLSRVALAQRDNTVYVGDQVTGGIYDTGGSEVYDLVIESRTNVTIRVERIHGSTLDPKVTVYDGDEMLGIDDDGGDGLNSRLSLTLNPGTYELLVEAVGSSTGEYELTIEERQVRASRATLNVGDSEMDYLEQGEAHEYSFRPGSSQRVAITVDRTEGSSIDPKVALVDDSGNQVGMNDDGGEGTNARLEIDVSPRTYTIVVTAFGTTSGEYRVAVNAADAWGDESESMGTLRLGGSATGYIESQMENRYTYVSEMSGQVRISVQKTSGSTLDPKVELRRAGGAQVGINDDGGEGNDALLIAQVDRGEYTIIVTGFSTTEGEYRLSIEEVASAGMGTISVGSTESGRLNDAGERQSYELRVTRNQQVVINLEKATGSALDPRWSCTAARSRSPSTTTAEKARTRASAAGSRPERTRSSFTDSDRAPAPTG